MKRLLSAAMVAALAATPAHASLIADGITYTLTEFTTGNPLTDQFVLSISGINGTSDTEGGRSGINALAFTLPSKFSTASMISPPSGYTFINGGLNSSGCDGKGNFYCFDNTSIPPTPSTPYPVNSSLNFTFDVTLSSGNFAGYVPDFKIDWAVSKNNYDLVSLPLPLSPTSTPEPASLALLGVGLIGLGYTTRRARSACRDYPPGGHPLAGLLQVSGRLPGDAKAGAALAGLVSLRAWDGQAQTVGGEHDVLTGDRDEFPTPERAGVTDQRQGPVAPTGERGTGMSRVETNHIESSPAQFMHKPRRHRASFNPNTRIVFRMTPHSPLDWFRLRMALPASEPAPSSVNDADRRQLLRNIQTNELGHRAPPMCEPPSDSARTTALWAVYGSRPQLPDVHTWFKSSR